MKISEYILQLQTLQARYGDLTVMGNNFGSQVCGACREAVAPCAANLAILQGREHVQRYHSKYSDTDANIGELVVRIT